MKRHSFIKQKHNIRRPIYGDGGNESDYYHFNGNIASNDEINEWVNEALTWFEENPDEPYWRVRISSGGSTVIVIKSQDDDDSPFSYEIIVAHQHYEATVRGE